MKIESLHALIIDRHCGELSPEAAELLDHHLATNATARQEAERVLASLNATREAVLRHPELARVPMVTSPLQRIVRVRSPLPWLARAAALALLAGAAGFYVGRVSPPSASASVIASATQVATPAKDSPWARYELSFDAARSGMTVVRVDTPSFSRP